MKFLKDDKAVKNSIVLLFGLCGLLFVYYIVFVLKPAFTEIKDLVYLIIGAIGGYITGTKGGRR